MDQHLIALGKVFSHLTEMGLPIFTPILKSDIPFDFILSSPGGTLYRTLVRYRSVQRGKIEINLKDSFKNVIDLMAVYCPDTEDIYFVKADEINKSLVLRVDEPKRYVPGANQISIFKDINRLFYGGDMFDIVVQGNALRKYSKDNDMWVAAEDNKPFKIVLENKTSKRRLYVVSVDGLNAIDGKEASEKGSGYVVPPFSKVTVDGWRKSHSEVSEFFFTKKENSYSNLKGDGVDNCGVIGVAIFDEKPRPTVMYDMMVTCDSYNLNTSGRYTKGLTRGLDLNNSFLPASANCADGDYTLSKCSDTSHKMGTGWGDTKQSHVREAEFDSKESPTAVMSVFYDSKENLIARGIIQVKERPNPFPNREFCQAP